MSAAKSARKSARPIAQARPAAIELPRRGLSENRSVPSEACCGSVVGPLFFTIPELAVRWRCSRGTVYNLIRGEKVVDFASPGHRGKKLVPAAVVYRIEETNMRVLR